MQFFIRNLSKILIFLEIQAVSFLIFRKSQAHFLIADFFFFFKLRVR